MNYVDKIRATIQANLQEVAIWSELLDALQAHVPNTLQVYVPGVGSLYYAALIGKRRKDRQSHPSVYYQKGGHWHVLFPWYVQSVTCASAAEAVQFAVEYALLPTKQASAYAASLLEQ